MSHHIVLEVLDGCARAALEEARHLGPARQHGRTEVHLDTDQLASLRNLRTVVAAYVRVDAEGRRPRVLKETSVQQRVGEVYEELRRLKPRMPFRALKLAAAGSDTDEMQELAQTLSETTSFPIDEVDGDAVVRVRRTGTKAEPTGWEMLIRTTPRPLATRSWRVVNYPGAVNATIAATCLDMLDVGEGDSILDLTCGSGTFLIEQLFRSKPERAVGIDLNAQALDAAKQHQRAARKPGKIEWLQGDALTTPLSGTFSRIITNPPWGTLHGHHEENEQLLIDLMERAAVVSAPKARLGILTHEISRMHSALEEDLPWKLVTEHRFFQKGHHPRFFILEKR